MMNAPRLRLVCFGSKVFRGSVLWKNTWLVKVTLISGSFLTFVMILHTSVNSNSVVEILHVCKSLNFLFRDLDDI